MAISLGSIDLDNDMVWSDQYQYSPVVSTVDRALSGRELIQIATRPTGQPITLESSQNSGWQSRDTVKSLHTLAASYSEFVLQIQGEQIPVRFRHEDGEPPVSFQPISLFNPENGTTEYWYYGTIRLATV